MSRPRAFLGPRRHRPPFPGGCPPPGSRRDVEFRHLSTAPFTALAPALVDIRGRCSCPLCVPAFSSSSADLQPSPGRPIRVLSNLKDTAGARAGRPAVGPGHVDTDGPEMCGPQRQRRGPGRPGPSGLRPTPSRRECSAPARRPGRISRRRTPLLSTPAYARRGGGGESGPGPAEPCGGFDTERLPGPAARPGPISLGRYQAGTRGRRPGRGPSGSASGSRSAVAPAAMTGPPRRTLRGRRQPERIDSLRSSPKRAPRFGLGAANPPISRGPIGPAPGTRRPGAPGARRRADGGGPTVAVAVCRRSDAPGRPHRREIGRASCRERVCQYV